MSEKTHYYQLMYAPQHPSSIRKDVIILPDFDVKKQTIEQRLEGYEAVKKEDLVIYTSYFNWSVTLTPNSISISIEEAMEGDNALEEMTNMCQGLGLPFEKDKLRSWKN